MRSGTSRVAWPPLFFISKYSQDSRALAVENSLHLGFGVDVGWLGHGGRKQEGYTRFPFDHCILIKRFLSRNPDVRILT